MFGFIETTHLSEIIEGSEKETVAILKYSNDCGSSARLVSEIEKIASHGKIMPIYLVTVQKHIVLSAKIAEMFEVKHESPQIFILKSGKVLYTEHHKKIDLNRIISPK
ncbi:MAG: bacillithiol system redox-active protein YtxJ [Minisyncoccia bacterium]